MSLFLRRHLQKYIDNLDTQLGPKVASRLVKQLNAKSVTPLGYEWEVVILWWFSRKYCIQYESGHANASKLDLIVYGPDSSLLFNADIRCVSDFGRHKENPVDRWSETLAKAKFDAGLSGELSWRVDGQLEGEFRDAKMQLCLPRNNSDWAAAEARVRHFAEACVRATTPKILYLADLAKGLEIRFKPQGKGLVGGHPSYTSIYSVRRNPVANALREKRKQWERAGAAGLTGTILCDGGCQLLHDRAAEPTAIRLDEVVLEYLKDERAVDFVVTLGVESTYFSRLFSQRGETHEIKAKFFSLRDASVIAPVLAAFQGFASGVLGPVMSPENARSFYASGIGQVGFRRKPMTHGGNRISVSLRWLTELLAGRISVEEAYKEYAKDAQSAIGLEANPFRRMLDSGRLPVKVEINRDPSADDDAITFEFGASDPAVAPFLARSQEA